MRASSNKEEMVSPHLQSSGAMVAMAWQGSNGVVVVECPAIVIRQHQ